MPTFGVNSSKPAKFGVVSAHPTKFGISSPSYSSSKASLNSVKKPSSKQPLQQQIKSVVASFEKMKM
jgi:hypothetical protein